MWGQLILFKIKNNMAASVSYCEKVIGTKLGSKVESQTSEQAKKDLMSDRIGG